MSQQTGRPSRYAWVPNALTVLRLAATACFPFAPTAWRAPLVLFAGLSDCADGYLARRLGATSWIGGLLDAIADKLFVWTVLLVLWSSSSLTLWQFGLLVSRDLAVAFAVIVVLAARYWEGFQKMPSRPFGKLTTLAVFAYLVAATLWVDSQGAATTLLVAAALSLFAAADYLLVLYYGWRERAVEARMG